MKQNYFKHILMCLCLFAGSNAFAYDAEIDGIYYNFSGDEATVTFGYSNSYSGTVVIPESIIYNSVTYRVTSIGEQAFNNCSALRSIVIPSSVTSIGSRSFLGCSSLTSVSIPSSVINIGYYAFYGCSSLKCVTIESSSIMSKNYTPSSSLIDIFGGQVEEYVIGNQVTSIGEHAFYNCIGLTSVTIGSGVTSIGEYAFMNCSGLTSVTIPNSVTSIGQGVFRNCRGLTSVTIPNSVTSIGDYAFWDCSGLTSVYISDLAAWCKIDFQTEYSNPLYSACHLYLNGEEVKNLVIPDGVANIGNYAFSNCSGLASVTISNSVTSIGSGSFRDCTGLTSVTIPNSVTSIGEEAFYYCNGLTSVHISDLAAWCKISFGNTEANPLNYAHHLYLNGEEVTNLIIPDGVTSISDHAFWDCSGLTSVTIPNSVTSIGSYVFMNCSGLTSVTIGSGVTSIGNRAFMNCSGLTSVHISDLAAWCKINFECYAVYYFECFSNPLYYAQHFYLNGEEIKELIIPDGVTSISDLAFLGCSGLTSVTIPNSVTSIGIYTFFGCSGLTSVTIPESVTAIGDYAFYGCRGLTSVTIPNSVTSIGSSAFSGCKLRNVLIKCTTPPSGGSAFSKQTLYHTTLYVPTGCWDTYAYDNNWYEFINIRETAMTEEQVSEQQAYTLMDANTFTYSVYDPVNDCIGTIKSVSSIDENNPNHSWQMMEAGGARYLYNIGAKKYVKKSGTGFELISTPEPIEVADSDNGLILGEQADRQWALVSNERMSTSQSAIDEVTAIKSLFSSSSNSEDVFDLSGRKLDKPQTGVNLIRKSDGTTRKVMVK